jgi:predicted ATP-grasp superfamily ATP-dependent carboligase
MTNKPITIDDIERAILLSKDLIEFEKAVYSLIKTEEPEKIISLHLPIEHPDKIEDPKTKRVRSKKRKIPKLSKKNLQPSGKGLRCFVVWKRGSKKISQ